MTTAVERATQLATPFCVRVAAALGWRELTFSAYTTIVMEHTPCGWIGIGPGEERPRHVPRFDEDWAATGPLIEREEIDIGAVRDGWIAEWYGPHGSAESPDLPWCDVYGVGTRDRGAAVKTPLLAACHMLIALAARGLLTVKSA